MEHLLEIKSLPALVLSLVIILCANLIKGIIQFIWDLREKQDKIRDSSVRDLIVSIKKTNSSINNIFTVLKILAGNRWPEIKEMLEENNKLEV